MSETVGIGLIGLGTVGSAVATRLIGQWEMLGARAGAVPVLRRVAVRDLTKQRAIDLKTATIGDDPVAVINDPRVEIVVEVMGGIETATALIERALNAGKTVVTANKAVMAMSGPRLWSIAAEHGAGLWFEASVAAGLPVVALLRDSLRSDLVHRVDAVINGTTNVILTRMRNDGLSLAAALAEAQARGYAEADPSSDIDGWDATYKLVIIAWLAFGCHLPVESVDRRGIGNLDRLDLGYLGQLGYTVKLLAHGETGPDARVHLRVRPTAVPPSHLLYDVDDSANAVIISSDLADTVMLRGLGAGGPSTASAVVSDIVAAIRARGRQPAPPPLIERVPLSDEDVEVAGYLRIRVGVESDARALVLQALEDRGVPVVEAIEKPPIDGSWPQLLVLTGQVPRAVHDRALETLDTLAVVREISCSLDRIEGA